MKGITIRFSDEVYELVRQEAARAGGGLTAYIREAAIGRAIIARAHRGEFAHTEQLNKAIRKFLADGAEPLHPGD